MKKDNILLLDGLNQIFRANIKFGTAKDGSEHSNVIVFNFLRSLRAIFEQFRPDKCFFVLEGYPKFRYALYPAYKANRIIKNGAVAEREDFSRQKDLILSLLPHLPIAVIRAANYEGDDVIYSLVNDLKDEKITIVSTDSDFTQLLQEFHQYQVSLFDPRKKEYISAPKDYSYLVWKSIAGDGSDNIPSIASDKKAIKIASSPDALKAFLSIEENRANFSLNRNLITMQLVPPEQLEISEGDLDPHALREKLAVLNLPSILEEKYWTRFIKTFEAKNE